MKKHVAIRAMQAPPRFSVEALGCMGLMLVTACGGAAGASATAATGSVAASTLAATSASLSANANQAASADANRATNENLTLGMEHILPMLHLLPHEAAMGLHCDPNATPERLSVCGEKVPGSAQATWSSCQLRPRPFGRDHRDNMHMPSPAWGSEANTSLDANGMAMNDPNATLQDAHGWHHRAPPVSQGTLTITASVTPDTNTVCDANTHIVANRKAVFSVRMGDANGPILVLSGTNSETMTQTTAHAAPNGNITLNLNRTTMGAGGNVLNSTVIAGTVQVSVDPNATDANMLNANGTEHTGPHHPMMNRLLNGSLTVNGDTVVLTGVVHHADCMWPTAGTVQRTDAHGTSHTLVFGPTCASATLDGTAITLPARHPEHPGRHPAP